jgi:hypothetical protein
MFRFQLGPQRWSKLAPNLLTREVEVPTSFDLHSC